MNEQLNIKITADTKDAQDNIKDTKKDVDSLGKESKDTSKEIDAAFEAAGSAISSAMKVAAGAIAAGAAAIAGLAISTREYRNEQAKLTTAFESAGASAETARSVYEELQGTLGDSGKAVEAANHLAQLTTNQQELAEWADICTGVYATFGDSLPIEGLTEAANETAKTGTVTGGLADALNWAGESEDAFNNKLAKCVTTQQREKLIRETLTKVYKKASDQYKKTNKDIIESNKATDKMNETMADMGEVVEPVLTELKKFGAAMLQKLQKPLEGVVGFIVDDLIPAIENITDWCKKNKGIIIGVITGVTAAMVTFKVATLAAKAAEEGITIATLARAAAQKVLNAAMAATPWGLVAVGVTGLVAGLTAWALSSDKAASEEAKLEWQMQRHQERAAQVNAEIARVNELTKQSAEVTAEAVDVFHRQSIALDEAKDSAVTYKAVLGEVTEEERASMDASREAAEAFREQKDAYNETVSSVSSQMGHITGLADELFRLADESGRVKEADEARVEFILGQLNEALGTEYSLVDGVIQKYNELETGIYEVIAAKTANNLLESANASYITALENEKVALETLNKSYDDYQIQLEKSNEKIENYKGQIGDLEKLVDDYAEKGDLISKSTTEFRIKQLKDLIKNEEGLIENKKKAHEKDVANYAEYQKEIDWYESAMMASQQGNYQEAINILTSKGIAYNDYGEEVDEATAKVLDSLYYEAIQAGVAAKKTKKNFEDGVDGYTQEMVDEAEQAYEEALGKFEDAYGDSVKVGGDFGDGLASGMEQKKSILRDKATSLVSSIFKAMRKEADSHSPSRKTMALGNDMGDGLEIGLDKSTNDVVKSAKNMIDKTILPIEGVISSISYENIGGIFNTSALAANSGKAAGGIRGAADISSAQWVDTLAKMFNTNGTPIVLQVDGKVFAETTVNSINQLTKQTGSLALNIM